MHYLRIKPDATNKDHIRWLSENPHMGEYLLSLIEYHQLSVDALIESIFTSDFFTKKDYNKILYVLTLSDLIMNDTQLDSFMANAYFFCLTINYRCSKDRDVKKVPDVSLAVKTAQAFDWDYQEYLESNVEVKGSLQSETQNIDVLFYCILNKMTLYIPVVEVHKGLFKKKMVGYMIDPKINAKGIFTIGNYDEKFVLHKTNIYKLFKEALDKNKSLIFHDKNDLFNYMTLDNHQLVLEILQINGFFPLASIRKEDIHSWVDEQDNYIYIESRYSPRYEQNTEDVRATFEKLNDHLYRALPTTRSNFYVTFSNRSKLIMMQT